MRGWRQILAIAWLSTVRVYRNPTNLIWIVGIPLLFGLVVGRFFAFTGDAGPPVAVADEDGGPAAMALVEGLKATPFRVRLVSRREAEEEIAAGRRDVALVIPQGFSAAVARGDQPRLEVLRGPAYRPGVVERRTRAVVAALVTGRTPPPVPVAVVSPDAGADGERFPWQRTLFAFYALFALSNLLQRAGVLHEERQAGTLQRALVMGLPYSHVLGGHLLGLVLVGLVQAAAIFALTGVLGAPWLAGGAGGVVLPALATLVAAAGLGLGLAGLTHSPAQVRNAAVILSVALAMLGGAFWPLEIVPGPVRQVASLSPVYWSMEALRSAFVYDSWVQLATPVAVLALMGALGLAVGIAGLRRYGT